MTDYIDLNIIEQNLKNGYYYGTFSFIADMRKMWVKAFKYLVEDEDLKNRLEVLRAQFE